MGYTNLPGIFQDKQDGALTIVPTNDSPIVMILGTSDQGRAEVIYQVNRTIDAAKEFGKEGTLTRGLYEASIAGAQNLRLFRIGAKAAQLNMVDNEIVLETVMKDDSAGEAYLMFWDDSELRLRIWRARDDELVYDNAPAYPGNRVDLGEIVITGTAISNGGTDFGSEVSPVTLEDADGTASAVYTAGDDGLALSRMQTYEALYNAYSLLEDQEIDVMIPMNVYLDDLNVMDMNAAEVTTRALASLSSYPANGSAQDVLGKMYVEEVEGQFYFWWWMPAQPASSTPVFSGAQIYPTSLAGASATETPTRTTAGGNPLTAADFHEVNFAHQLAMFCHKQSTDVLDVTGVIGTLPPKSFTLKDVALWVGQLPEFIADNDGKLVVSKNGTGLLGNKFMSGRARYPDNATGVPALSIDGVAGFANGGLILTDTGFVDGVQLKDNNDHLVDLGKYISVVATYPVLSNPSRITAYTASGATTYAGFYQSLPATSAPTNKLLGNIRLPFRINISKLDLLAGQRYVTFHQKPKGVVISDAPTAARPDSDYQRLSTVRQVKVAVDAMREAGEPFLGEGMTGAQMAALETALDRSLQRMVKGGVLRRYEFKLIVTPQMRVLGQVIVELKLVPAFELRQITIVVGLAAV